MTQKGLRRSIRQMLLLSVLSLQSACPPLAQHHELDQALVEAVGKNDMGTATALLKQGANANVRDDSGRYFFFARRKLYEPPQVPFDPLNTQSRDVAIPDVPIELDTRVAWVTVLDIAVRANNLELVKTLLDHGGDANSRTEDGYPLLRTAAEQAKSEIVTALLQHGAGVNARDTDGGTALLGAVTEGKWPFGPFGTGRPEIVKLLLAKGAKINVRDNSGNTVLYYAVVNAHTTGELIVVKALLKAGADPNIADTSGDTPLMWTAKGEASDLTKLLLRAGAKVDTKNVYGYTALMNWAMSSAFPSTETGKILLAHGANVNARDRSGRTVLDLALSATPSPFQFDNHNHSAILALLRKAGAKQSEKRGARRSGI